MLKKMERRKGEKNLTNLIHVFFFLKKRVGHFFSETSLSNWRLIQNCDRF